MVGRTSLRRMMAAIACFALAVRVLGACVAVSPWKGGLVLGGLRWWQVAVPMWTLWWRELLGLPALHTDPHNQLPPTYRLAVWMGDYVLRLTTLVGLILSLAGARLFFTGRRPRPVRQNPSSAR